MSTKLKYHESKSRQRPVIIKESNSIVSQIRLMNNDKQLKVLWELYSKNPRILAAINSRNESDSKLDYNKIKSGHPFSEKEKKEFNSRIENLRKNLDCMDRIIESKLDKKDLQYVSMINSVASKKSAQQIEMLNSMPRENLAKMHSILKKAPNLLPMTNLDVRTIFDNIQTVIYTESILKTPFYLIFDRIEKQQFIMGLLKSNEKDRQNILTQQNKESIGALKHLLSSVITKPERYDHFKAHMEELKKLQKQIDINQAIVKTPKQAGLFAHSSRFFPSQKADRIESVQISQHRPRKK